MTEVMIKVLNMSVTAGCAALLVIALRLIALRLIAGRLPKLFFYGLWLVVLFKFLCPVVFYSEFSLMPVYGEPVSQDIIYKDLPSINTGVVWVDRPVNQILGRTMPAVPESSINPIQIFLVLITIVWQAGMLIYFLYHMAGYISLKRRLGTAVKAEDGVYESDQIGGAFLLGLVKPVIYLPLGLKEDERICILTHEQVHKQRKDYIVKLLGFFMVMIHWFNPLAHISFRLMCQDMEMSCDEEVIRRLGEGEKGSYSMALLHAAEGEHTTSYPLAFGESHTKSRVKNILNYRKPGFWFVLILGIALIGVAIGLLTSQKGDNIAIIGGADGPTTIFVAGKDEEGNTATNQWSPDVYWRPDVKWLLDQPVSGTASVDQPSESITLDYISANEVIFHGDFGLFNFKLTDESWKQEYYIKPEEMGRLPEILGSVRVEYGEEQQKRNTGFLQAGNGEEVCSLLDLSYIIYDKDTDETTQIFLFESDGREKVHKGNSLSERHYLFEKNGFSYFYRTPETALEFEILDGKEPESYQFPYDRMELIRYSNGQTDVLDRLMFFSQIDNLNVIYTENKIIYTGAAEGELVEFKGNPNLISMNYDGSDRRTADLLYNVYRGLSYDNGWLYYEGWVNDNAFPRPVYRMKTDFTDIEKLGEIDGSLIVASDDMLYYLDREKPAIVRCSREDTGNKEYIDKCGFDAERYRSIGAEIKDGVLSVRFYDMSDWKIMDIYEVQLPEKK